MARPAAAKVADAAPPYPPLPAGHGASGEELRAQIRAIVEEAVGPWQRALQNQQRTVLELLQRLEDMERRIPSAARGVVGAGLPNLAPSSVPPVAVMASSISAAPGPPMFSAASVASTAIELSSADQRVLAALEGRSRRRHLVLTSVLVIVLLFGGLGIAVALSYMPHAQ